MDTPNVESNSALDANQAAALFSQLDEPPKEETVDTELDTPQEQVKAEETQPPEPEDGIEIEVDGKPVKLTKAELAEAIKGQMRQSDYTKKTMEVAEQRKEATKEIEQARYQRDQYQSALQQQAQTLQALMGEQNKVDWNQLLDSDPVEYLKQKNLFEQRQAALQQNIQQQQFIAQQRQAEENENRSRYLSQQQNDLLAKLPEWKDEGKAKAEKSALAKYLTDFGYASDEVAQISDHKAVILARKAMLYDQMVSKAQASAKKVENLPRRVERPSVSDASPNLDKRNAQYQRLAKSGRAEDAAALLSNFL
jgi:hypothetical protein